MSYQKHLKYQRYLINSTLTGLTLEPSETSKIAPKPLQGLQGRSQWPPRNPPGSKGHPRDPKRAPRDFRRASFRVLAGAETTIEPEHFVRNRRRSKHLNISLVLRTHQTHFWPGGMRAAFKSAVSNGYMASMEGYVRPPVPWGGSPPLTPPPGLRMPPG